MTVLLLSPTYLALNSDTVSQYLRGMLHRDQRRQLRSNSSALQLIIPRTKKCIGDRAFSVYATRLRNDLPVQIRNTPSHRTFKGAYTHTQCSTQYAVRSEQRAVSFLLPPVHLTCAKHTAAARRAVLRQYAAAIASGAIFTACCSQLRGGNPNNDVM